MKRLATVAFRRRASGGVGREIAALVWALGFIGACAGEPTSEDDEKAASTTATAPEATSSGSSQPVDGDEASAGDNGEDASDDSGGDRGDDPEAPDDVAPWPMIHGPFGNYTSYVWETPLVDVATEAELLWVSEETNIPVGKLRASSNPYDRPSGGVASLIQAEGKIFVAYFEVPELDYPKGEPADDVLLAIDAETGETVWKATMVGLGLNRPPTKRGGYGVTPVYADGRVVSLGSNGELYAFSAADGELLWQVSQGEAANDMLVSLVVADGVVVVPSYASSVGLSGYDLATGERLWTGENLTGHRATPALFRDGARDYLLVGNLDGVMRLLEPRTGEAQWQVEGLGRLSFTLTPSDRFVMVDVQPEGHRLYGAYALGVDGASEVWRLPDELRYRTENSGDADGLRRVLPHGDAFFYHHIASKDDADNPSPRLLEIDAATGEIRRDVSFADTDTGGTWPGYIWVYDNLLVYNQDATHRSHQLQFWSLDLAPMGETWHPDHDGTTGYEVPMAEPIVDGRIYMRTAEGTIRAYDFRR